MNFATVDLPKFSSYPCALRPFILRARQRPATELCILVLWLNMSPYTDHALQSDNATLGRPQILHQHGSLPQRGHQALHFRHFCPLRRVEESCAPNSCHSTVRADIPVGIQRRWVETGDPGNTVHLREHAAVRGSGEPGSSAFPGLVPAEGAPQVQTWPRGCKVADKT